ncbi:hypothetical protein H7Y40_02560 [Pedobacter sp.]|nr:hypothetical protein [Candidatus Saccharibacteria bacterium]
MAKIFREDTPNIIFTKRHVVIGIVSILVIIGASVAFLLISKQVTQQSTVAFTIDGKSYSKNEVTSLIKYSTQRGGTPEETAKVAFDYLKRQAAAKKAGIAISEAKLTEARDSLFPDNKTSYDIDGAPWIELASYNEALTRVFSSSKLTDASGYVFIFPFDNLIARDIIPISEQPKGYGDATLIARDRAYAKERAEHYRDALKSNTLTPELALAEVKADARLGQIDLPNTNISVRFIGFMSEDATRPERYISGQAKDEVMSLSNSISIGDVKVGKNAKGETPTKSDDDYVETYYYFVNIDKPSNSSQNSKTGFELVLKELPASYKGLK